MWKRITVRQGVRYGREFIKHIVPAILKPARTLWNEVIGFLFLCLAVFFGSGTGRYARDYMKAGPGGGAGELMGLVMAGFCTFYDGLVRCVFFPARARKISRS